jgi:tRNA(adenine34) deaminase
VKVKLFCPKTPPEAGFNAACQIFVILKQNLIIVEKSDTMTFAILLIFIVVLIYLITILQGTVMMQRDEHYMKIALECARQAGQQGEVPVGAVVISAYGELLGADHNAVERAQSQIFHAEVQAINAASKKMGTWRLDGCTLYVTLEPCMMCISLCALSRIERIVYGAESPIFGYRLDKEGVLALYTKQIKNITSNVLANDAALILKDFFSQKRKG